MSALSIALVAVAAALTLYAMRYGQDRRRAPLLGAATALVILPAFADTGFGGFWPSLYTLLTAYFLFCILMPWIELGWRRRQDAG